MDRITNSLLDEFSKEQAISSLPEEARFERFATFLCTQRYYGDAFDPSELAVGSGGDTGIDGITILVNGQLVLDVETVIDLVTSNGYLDAMFIFVQAERSSSFETAKIGQFSYGVVDFFRELPTLPRNQKVVDAAEVMNAVFSHSSKFKRGNPICKLFYVTTGKWQNDSNLEARRKAAQGDLEALGLFREVDVSAIGAEGLQQLYRQSKNAIARDFNFPERTTIPQINGVSEAYLGLIPAPEFLRLLTDENGEIIKSLFYDNVRDWQDFNAVNTEMRTTLASEELRQRFALLNNGVTIIAKTLRPTGDRFYIEDYQVVNGCQTSHVLFDQRSLLDEKVRVPLRLIATQDEDVTTSIIQATNRQTEVKREQLLALSDFQKKLESFFQTFTDTKRLYYERRSRQYGSSTGIEKTRIITPANLIRAFAAIFLEEPHRTTRNYGALLEQVGKNIFETSHRLEPYYTCAVALYELEYQFRNQIIDARYKVARFQILLAARLLLNREDIPRMNSRDMERYCNGALEVWWDATSAGDLLRVAVEQVDVVAQGNYDRDHIRSQKFTEDLKRAALATTWRRPA